MQSNVVCPISDERVNESVVRTIAVFVFAIGIIILFTGIKWLGLFLIADFAARAFTPGDYSILRIVAKATAKTFKLKVKLIDAAPKKFAALVGFIFAIVITASLFIGWNITATVFATVLIICAGLEAFAGYCVGCQFYTWLVLPAKKLFNKV
jgi:hypothetical protein